VSALLNVLPLRVGFADVSDDRVRAAARALAASAAIKPVLVGTPAELNGVDGFETVVVDDGTPILDALAALVRDGSAAAGIAGSLSSSPAVIRAGIRGLGARGLVSGCFLMRRGQQTATFADCSVVPDPTAEQLVDIAIAAADFHRAATHETPLVGMLSFSTGGSAEHPHVHKVRAATGLLQAARPDLDVDGEMQFDVAVDADVGLRKLPGSSVAGRANVLVFPTLDAGNIAYKIAERVGGARALGSFVLNLTHPWVDLSRGCTTQDLIDTAQLVSRAATANRTKEQIAR
jgi:phosphate acetyltransferase